MATDRRWYCRLSADVPVSDHVVSRLKEEMSLLCQRNLPFLRKERLTSDVIEIFDKQGLDDKVLLLKRI